MSEQIVKVNEKQSTWTNMVDNMPSGNDGLLSVGLTPAVKGSMITNLDDKLYIPAIQAYYNIAGGEYYYQDAYFDAVYGQFTVSQIDNDANGKINVSRDWVNEKLGDKASVVDLTAHINDLANPHDSDLVKVLTQGSNGYGESIQNLGNTAIGQEPSASTYSDIRRGYSVVSTGDGSFPSHVLERTGGINWTDARYENYIGDTGAYYFTQKDHGTVYWVGSNGHVEYETLVAMNQSNAQIDAGEVETLVNKRWVNSKISEGLDNKYTLSGDTLTGDMNVNGKNLIDVNTMYFGEQGTVSRHGVIHGRTLSFEVTADVEDSAVRSGLAIQSSSQYADYGTKLFWANTTNGEEQYIRCTNDKILNTNTVTQYDTGSDETTVNKGILEAKRYKTEDIKGPTGFTDPANINMDYNSITGVLTLTGNVKALYRNEVVDALVSGWQSPSVLLTFPTPNQGYYLYYNGSDFVWSTMPWDFADAMILYVYYRTDGTFVFGLRECHGLMDHRAHEEFHQTIGTYKVSGGTLSDYVLNSTTPADRRPANDATVIKDEDLPTSHPAKLSGNYTHARMTGADTIISDWDNDDIVKLSGSRPYWNEFNGSTWQDTLVNTNRYMNVWVYSFPATDDAESQRYAYHYVQGQYSGNLNSTRNRTTKELQLGGITNITPEAVFLNQIIIRYSGGNWRIVEVIDLGGTAKEQTSSPSGNFLSEVASNPAQFSGVGTTVDPLNLVEDYATVAELATKEDAFSKNTAFNRDFGTTAGTVAEGAETESKLNDKANQNDFSSHLISTNPHPSAGFYKRDGSLPLTDDMDAGGNEIGGANSFSTQSGSHKGTSVLETVNLGDYTTLAGQTGSNYGYIFQNVYFDGAFRFKKAGTAEYISFTPDGNLLLIRKSTVSGLADEPITWDDTLQLDNDGVQTLPQTTPANIIAQGGKAVLTKETGDQLYYNVAGDILTGDMDANDKDINNIGAIDFGTGNKVLQSSTGYSRDMIGCYYDGANYRATTTDHRPTVGISRSLDGNPIVKISGIATAIPSSIGNVVTFTDYEYVIDDGTILLPQTTPTSIIAQGDKAVLTKETGDQLYSSATWTTWTTALLVGSDQTAMNIQYKIENGIVTMKIPHTTKHYGAGVGGDVAILGGLPSAIQPSKKKFVPIMINVAAGDNTGHGSPSEYWLKIPNYTASVNVVTKSVAFADVSITGSGEIGFFGQTIMYNLD